MIISKKVILTIIIIEIFLILIAFFTPFSVLSTFYKVSGKNLDKILVHFQATTGPRHWIKEDEAVLKRLINIKYQNVNTTEIELVGNTSFEFEEDSLTGDKVTLVYGKVIGVTDKYEDSGDGIIPVFKVYYFVPQNYPFNFNLNNIIFIVFILYQVLILLVICVSIYRKRKTTF